MNSTEQSGIAPLGRIAQVSFVVLMLGLTALFVVLGMWQVERLGQKEAQIAAVEARFDLAPVPFPPVREWDAIDPEALDFRPVSLTGQFDHTQTVLVFDNLVDARGQYGGAGYWVMAPLRVADGGIVWINRGFVPSHLASSYAQGGVVDDEAEQTIEGVVRRAERANAFTPGSELSERRDWVRNPERLSAFLSENDVPVAPVTIDLPAGEFGALPQGGETEIVFSNRHLEYAGTWFAFAGITPIMLGFWLWRQRRSRRLP